MIDEHLGSKPILDPIMIRSTPFAFYLLSLRNEPPLDSITARLTHPVQYFQLVILGSTYLTRARRGSVTQYTVWAARLLNN